MMVMGGISGANREYLHMCRVEFEVKYKGSHYHLSDSMLVKSSFDSIKDAYFKSLMNDQWKSLENVCKSNDVQLQTYALHEKEHDTSEKGMMDFHVTNIPYVIADKLILSNHCEILLERVEGGLEEQLRMDK
ncbi:hypothetical protein QJS10_CPB11g01489 [Acorus calamus]|uniref:Uncharacterized protein n=1 Tax=Acorus calamus TaxID=4465 RepID=A0AAV9DSF2_ACOCL|nr:hypothetical protein QJS10_CPB11g01489 [Acorus calamus]